MQNNAQIYTKVFRVFLVDVWVAVRVLKPCSWAVLQQQKAQKTTRVYSSSGMTQSDASFQHAIFDTSWRHNVRRRSQTGQSHRAVQGERQSSCWRRSWRNPPRFVSSSCFLVCVGHEQRRGGLHRPEAGVRPVLQPLVRREVLEGGPERRPVYRDVPEVPAVRAEGHQGEGHPDRRSGVHGPQQGQTRELMERKHPHRCHYTLLPVARVHEAHWACAGAETMPQ